MPNRIKIYPEDLNKEATRDNLVLELDGVKLENVASFKFEILPNGQPLTTVSLIVAPNIESDSEVTTDFVEF